MAHPPVSPASSVAPTGAGALAARLRWALLALRRWRWPALGVAWGIGVLGALVVMLVPQRFEASARIFVDTQTVLKPMMVGLTYQPDIEQQLRMLVRTLISRTNMQRLMAQPQVGPRFGGAAAREQAVALLTDRIRIVTAERANIYTIAYRDTDARRALAVVQGTLSLFVDTGEEGKKQGSIDAERFMDAQIQASEARLVEAEAHLKDFKVRNFGVTGVSDQDYFTRLSTLGDEVSKLRNDLGAAEHTRDTYRQALATEDPQLPPESLPGAAALAVPEIDARIEAQRKQLDELLRRYTELHPDVIGARRVVAQLEAQKRREQTERAQQRRLNPQGTAATSPVYQRLRVALAESDAQVAALRSQLGEKAEQLAQVRARANRQPQVEAELAQISRSYDVLRKNHDQLLARRESASLGVKLDESRQLADFRVLEPPNVPSTPVFPGRRHLAFGVVLGALLAGVATALVIDVLRPSFDDAQALEQASGRVVLGSLGLARTAAWRRAAQADLRRFAAAAALLAGGQAAWLAWVLWRTAP